MPLTFSRRQCHLEVGKWCGEQKDRLNGSISHHSDVFRIYRENEMPNAYDILIFSKASP